MSAVTPTRARAAGSALLVAGLLALAAVGPGAAPAEATASDTLIVVGGQGSSLSDLTAHDVQSSLVCATGAGAALVISTTVWTEVPTMAQNSGSTKTLIGVSSGAWQYPIGQVAFSRPTLAVTAGSPIGTLTGAFAAGTTSWRGRLDGDAANPGLSTGNPLTDFFTLPSSEPRVYGLALICMNGSGTAASSQQTAMVDLGAGAAPNQYLFQMAFTTFTLNPDGSWFTGSGAAAAAETHTALTATKNGNDTATLSATVTAGGDPVAAGKVEFYDGATKVGEDTTGSASGVYDFTTLVLPTGDHPFTATYVPASEDFLGSTSSPAQVVTISAASAATTSTTLQATHADPTATSATLTATVRTPQGGSTPVTAGKVEFYLGAGETNKLGEQTVNGSGVATWSLSGLAVGTYTYHAKFVPASGSFSGSASGDAQVIVQAPPAEEDETTLLLEAAGDVSTTGELSIGVAAAVSFDGELAADADGTVQFYRDDVELGDEVEVEDGLAEYSDADVEFGTEYEYRAVFTPAGGSELEEAESEVVTITVAAPTTLTSGMTVEAGAVYKVSAPDGTFDANDTVEGVVNSTPIAVGSATATGAGALPTFAFAMPTGLTPGAHSLVLTGATGKTYTVSFSVAAGSNPPASFATDWVGQAAANPTVLVALFGALLALVAVAVVAWNVVWRRHRRSARAN